MKLIVGVADMKVSNNPVESIITYPLGSCIGLVLYDPVVKVGGDTALYASINTEKAKERSYMFADSGIPRDRLPEEHLSGTLTEMLNMVCGNALSKTEPCVPFDLGIPEVIDTDRECAV